MLQSLAVAIPKYVVDRSQMGDLSSFEKVTGIVATRRYPGNISMLMHEAALKAVEKFERSTIEAVVVVTQSASRALPAMALDIVKRLELRPTIPAFDVNQSCCGFVYGLFLARRLGVRTLLICADKLRMNGVPNSLMFSDAASACVIDPFHGMLTRFFNDPTGISSLWGSHNEEEGLHMEGDKVFDFVTKFIPSFIKQHTRCDWLCPHQANESMMKILAKRSGYEENFLNVIRQYGNQSMVSIPMALAASESKILGSSILLCGYGAGFSAALTRVVWGRKQIASIIEV